MLSGHRRVAPFGLQGGQAGKTGRNTRIRASGERQELPGCTSMRFEAGDILRIDTPGGGGFGKP